MTHPGFLEGIRVVDLSQYVPGPFATRQLADLGADVIKIEPPNGDPMRKFMATDSAQVSPIYRHVNRGKRIARIDLKSKDGLDRIKALLADADILLESFRPGTLERLGLDRQTLKSINPILIHCALSGYGQTGPYRDRGGHDINYIAAASGLSLQGTSKRPVMIYPPLADHAGAMQASTLILAALAGRYKSGKGSYIDVSLFESALSWQYLAILNPDSKRAQAELNGGSASYNIYECSDGRFFSIGAIEPHFWQRFCEALGRADWIERKLDDLPQTSLISEVSSWVKKKALAEWEKMLEGVDCCFEPLCELNQLSQHPQIADRQALDDFGPTYPARINDDPYSVDNKFNEVESIAWRDRNP
ncbi:MAG: alpha-methylacyl-CoA racemase [Gammaproteobacteria bacterium]